jgi:hypothetical protein
MVNLVVNFPAKLERRLTEKQFDPFATFAGKGNGLTKAPDDLGSARESQIGWRAQHIEHWWQTEHSR